MSTPGILLCQVGTPESPTSEAVRIYLREFLSDPKVVPADKFWWKVLLNVMILPLRSTKVAAKYREIWMPGGSPLRVYSESCLTTMRDALNGSAHVELGMRYGRPSIADGIRSLVRKGCNNVILFPLYPHYGEATVGSFFEAAQSLIAKDGLPATLDVFPPYHKHPCWLAAEASLINGTLLAASSLPDHLLLSYHGIPMASVRAGDRYPQNCEESTKALTPMLQFPAEGIVHCYHSRFGYAQWTKPYTENVIRELASRGTKHLAIACPGFPCDCLETLHEVGVEYRVAFLKAGGERFTFIPGLNADTEWIRGMAQEIGNCSLPDGN